MRLTKPVSVNLIALFSRLFDPNFKPICHNCPSEDPHCCHQKKNIVSPDYAFKNDREKRLENIHELQLRGITV